MERTFTDTEGEVINFYGSSPNKKAATKDFSMATTEIVSVNQEAQAVERQHAEVQTDAETVNTASEYDEVALLDFMRRFAPRVEAELRKRNQHFGVNFQRSLPEEDEDDVVTKKIGVLPKYEKVVEIKSRQVSWSCYGNKIAISFGYIKHDTWCKHSCFILIYESDKNEEFTNEPKEYIEINTCIVDMKFHPTMNSILVFASEEGRINWHNTTDSLESNSKNYIQCKCMKITQLSWVELNSSLYLAVADSEGFLNLWNTSSYIKDWNLWRRFSFKTAGSVNDRAVTCFDFSINPQHFVVALEGGTLLQCSSILTSSGDDQMYNPVVCDFECSSLVIHHIAFSKFEEKIFVISSHDEYLKVYRLSEKVAIFSIAIDHVPLGLEWSHLQDNILNVWFTNGEIRHYDYCKCSLIKTLKLENVIQVLSFKVKGMKLLCLAVDNENQATIWQTGLFVK